MDGILVDIRFTLYTRPCLLMGIEVFCSSFGVFRLFTCDR